MPWQFILGNVDYPNMVESGITDDSITDYSIKLSYEFNDYATVYGGIATGYQASQSNMPRDTRPTETTINALVAVCNSMPNNFMATTADDGEVIELPRRCPVNSCCKRRYF